MTFFIFGDPKGQPRARALARKMGSKSVARMYDSDVADGSQSVILEQVTNGIAVRMAVLYLCAGGAGIPA